MMNSKNQGQTQGGQLILNQQGIGALPSNSMDNVNVPEKQESQESRLNIVFSNLTYSVQIEEKNDNPAIKEKMMKEKVLLNNLSGICRGGEVSAIMGPSGAGKTTLLNLLACRIESKEGKVMVNNIPYNYESFGNFANYVMQQDVLMQTLTVRETLQFAARLKLNIPEADQDEKIMELCKRLKLEKCLDVLVGGKLIKGISGGEKKRTSIAFELISDPSVIMLDEPTSGLDSLTSYIIIDFLAELAHKQNKTVLMTIHQPSSEIFFRFDNLFLLVDGNLVYQGRAVDGVDYFASKLNKKMAEFVNPADYFIQEMHPQNKDIKDSIPLYCEIYNKQLMPNIVKQITEIQQIDNIPCRESATSLSSTYSVLLKRDVLNTIRNPMIVKSRFFMTLFLSIYTGGLYFNAARSDISIEANWQTIVGYFYFMAISNMMASLSPVSLVFPAERDVFLKEEGSRFYSVLPYFISRNLVEIPYLIIFPMLTNLILYWMVGQASTAQQFFLFYFISFIVTFAGSSLGLLIGSISKDQKSGAAITPIIILPIFIFAGVFKNRANLPSWIGWFEYLSPLKYGFASSLMNQVSGKYSRVSELNFDLSIWGSIGTLIGLSIGFRLLSLFFLWWLRKKLE